MLTVKRTLSKRKQVIWLRVAALCAPEMTRANAPADAPAGDHLRYAALRALNGPEPFPTIRHEHIDEPSLCHL